MCRIPHAEQRDVGVIGLPVVHLVRQALVALVVDVVVRLEHHVEPGFGRGIRERGGAVEARAVLPHLQEVAALGRPHHRLLIDDADVGCGDLLGDVGVDVVVVGGAVLLQAARRHGVAHEDVADVHDVDLHVAGGRVVHDGQGCSGVGAAEDGFGGEGLHDGAYGGGQAHHEQNGCDYRKRDQKHAEADTPAHFGREIKGSRYREILFVHEVSRRPARCHIHRLNSPGITLCRAINHGDYHTSSGVPYRSQSTICCGF